MVVVDSSAVIPLSRVGELSLIEELFSEVHTTEGVRRETVVDGEGYPGVASIESFLDRATVHESPEGASSVADREGIETADASVVLLAEELETSLLANDKALIRVARAHGIECYWVTSLLFAAVSEGLREVDETQRLLEALVEGGMTLSPSVFVKVRRRLEELE